MFNINIDIKPNFWFKNRIVSWFKNAFNAYNIYNTELGKQVGNNIILTNII